MVTIHSACTFDKPQASFNTTDWKALTETLTNIHEITDVINSYIKFNENILTEKKTTNVYNNNKPWITSSLLRELITQKTSPAYLSNAKEINTEIDNTKRICKDKVKRLDAGCIEGAQAVDRPRQEQEGKHLTYQRRIC